MRIEKQKAEGRKQKAAKTKAAIDCLLLSALCLLFSAIVTPARCACVSLEMLLFSVAAQRISAN
ncbi:MAG: hypothetical protein QOC96_1256 [Acidobacteriota bacterium]|jgi:hypothetical protein|nr:hypothetical protein [Acidobacteriota bacterium]